MAIYYQKDLKVSTDGDVVVASNGDLDIADAPDSLKDALKFMMSTDYDEMDVMNGFGSNQGSLIGERDPNFVLCQNPVLLNEGLKVQGLATQAVVQVRALMVEVDQLLIYLIVNGQFINDDGTVLTNPEMTLRWVFPYTASPITAL